MEELLDADEVFCTGTAVVVSPVGSVTYCGKRLLFVHYLLVFRFGISILLINKW